MLMPIGHLLQPDASRGFDDIFRQKTVTVSEVFALPSATRGRSDTTGLLTSCSGLADVSAAILKKWVPCDPSMTTPQSRTCARAEQWSLSGNSGLVMMASRSKVTRNGSWAP
jgi:hypothetical protein